MQRGSDDGLKRKTGKKISSPPGIKKKIHQHREMGRNGEVFG